MDKKNFCGVGFVDLLTIAFIVLKLCGVIKWSWLWVLSPIWITLSVIGVCAVVILICRLISKNK